MFDVVIVGAGHAGCEAAFACALMGKRVLLTCTDVRTVAFLACNPSIGGTGKSHLVYEIDAMGGLMGRLADKCCIQMRILNQANGPAVQALRAQVDRHEYHASMLAEIQNTPNIHLRECEVTEILADTTVNGICLSTGEKIICNKVIVASGVYLNSTIFIGQTSRDEGPAGFARSSYLTSSLIKLGVTVRRFNTNTPPRVLSSTVDYKKTTPQTGDSAAAFSVMTNNPPRNVIQCHLTYTNDNTHKIIHDNIKYLPTYGGAGPRYCPSIEDKVIRFPHVNRHQIFLEPESLSTEDIYVQGLFTSLPHEAQKKMVHSVSGLEKAEIACHAYGIEYDCIDSTQLYPTLEFKKIRGLYFAGQVNGTSGYEEAAAQGIIAGTNTASEKQIILSRTNSYIGVLIDDLVTVGTNEPYRMFTSRAEHRLFLRKDNADQRLTPLAHELGLINDKHWNMFQEKMKLVEKARAGGPVPNHICEIIEIENLYAGYLARESKKINEAKRCEQTVLPRDFDYSTIIALRKESQTKLNQIKPHTIAQAMRISGVTPADINILLVWFKKNRI